MEDLKKKKIKKAAELHTESINFKNEKGANPKAIKIATPSKNYQNRKEKVRIGIFTHEILAKINAEEDIERTLQTYLLAGTITDAEKIEITERILSTIHHPEYSKYFAENQRVINEKDIMLSENGESKIYRPDRLIETENGFIIIDFKTGEPEEKHQDQIEQYQSVLQKLGKTVLETVLIYI